MKRLISPSPRIRFARGFTLLELLVAVSIFGVVMAIAYQGLSRAAQGGAEFEQRIERLGALQLAASMLERDLSQAIPRSFRDRYGDRKPALIGTPVSIELTRLGVAAGPFPERPLIERITWQNDDDTLVRLLWPVLDRAPGSVPQSAEVLTSISELRFEYLLAGGGWLSDWPPPQAPLNTMPRAIRVRVEVDGFGRLERLLELPLNGPPTTPDDGPGSGLGAAR